jgi:amino acid transporter
MPVAILSSLLVASLLYCVVQWVLVSSTPTLGAVSDTPLADAALKVAPVLGVVVAAGGIISTFGFVAGSALGTPRYAYAAAVDRFLPQSLAQTHSVFESPHRAIVASALIATLLALGFDYRALVGMSNVTVAAQYLLTCLAVLQLRRTAGVAPFVAFGGVFTPLVGALVSLWVFTEASAVELLFAAASMVVGVVIWRLSRG